MSPGGFRHIKKIETDEWSSRLPRWSSAHSLSSLWMRIKLHCRLLWRHYTVSETHTVFTKPSLVSALYNEQTDYCVCLVFAVCKTSENKERTGQSEWDASSSSFKCDEGKSLWAMELGPPGYWGHSRGCCSASITMPIRFAIFPMMPSKSWKCLLVAGMWQTVSERRPLAAAAPPQTGVYRPDRHPNMEIPPDMAVLFSTCDAEWLDLILFSVLHLIDWACTRDEPI